MRLIIATTLTLISTAAMAEDTYVHGYYRQNGTYVEPHHRTAPDHDIYNNYSTQGNVNPYTGQQGTVNPYNYNSNNLNNYGNTYNGRRY